MKRWALVTVTILATVSFVTGPSAPTAWAQPLPAEEEGSWPMVAATPQRTSWVTSEVAGDIFSGSMTINWYRPIEAYIPQNFQIIAANGLIYLATARGLYALNADTGQLVWRFDTEVPLGNSPTIDTEVTPNVLYVGGYDRKLYALNAISGNKLWEFYAAKAGYDTNPLVVENRVIIGNRDGNLYAVNRYISPSSPGGTLGWKYQVGGAIVQSPAYKDGVVYLAASDSYAYAINSDGSLKWKSPQKLPGDGYYSYWPVIYTDPTTSKDWVIFSGTSGYRTWSDPGDSSDPGYGDINYIYSGPPGSSALTLAPIVSPSPAWANGRIVVDYDQVVSHLSNSAQQRQYTLLDGSNGAEAAFPIPVLRWMTNTGNVYPPTVSGVDHLLYFGNQYFDDWQGRIMGWKFGTRYFVLGPQQGAPDEPNAISGGGKYIYRSICCDRVGDWYDTSTESYMSYFWHYTRNLEEIAPGYDSMWWCPTSWSNMEGLYCNFMNVNGAYDSHGVQNPIVPYRGKIYIHRSNAVIAIGPPSARLATPNVGLLEKANIQQTLDVVSTADLTTRLESEIRKIVAAGHLRPGYYSQTPSADYFPELNDYFDNPSDTLLSLSMAYPRISDSTLKQQLRSYLQTEYNSYFASTMYASVGWADGAGRESMPLPPEVQSDLTNHPKQASVDTNPWHWSYPQNSFYGMWKYAQNVVPENASAIYAKAKSKIEVPAPASDDYYQSKPWILNARITGLIGFLRLQELANMTSDPDRPRSQVLDELNRLLQYRVTHFSKDAPLPSGGYVYSPLGQYKIAANFMNLVPEFYDELVRLDLYTSFRNKVQDAVNEYYNTGSYWFVSRYDATISEGAAEQLYDYPAIFQAKAWVLREPREELGKWLDVPAFERGDLFYIQNLVAAIEAEPAGPAPTFVDVPFSHPYHDVIEALYQAGYTAGCNTSPLMYCPEQTMNRAESSVFVERGIHTASYDPTAPASQVFADLALDSWAAKWVNGLWEDRYTAGCGTNPLIYCPWQGHTRAEGCVFYLRMLRGASYEPPKPTRQTFVDVPLDAWYAKWVQAGYDAGLLTACQTTPELRVCPSDPLTRALAAYMMYQAKLGPAATPTAPPPTPTPAPSSPTPVLTRTASPTTQPNPTPTPTAVSTPTSTANPPSDQAKVIDHTDADASRIPASWLQTVREKMVWIYVHQSHGVQLISGANYLKASVSPVDFNFVVTGESQGIPAQTDSIALRMQEMEWSPGDLFSAQLRPGIEQKINAALPRLQPGEQLGFLFAWCGDMSFYSTAQVQDYLEAMAAMEAKYPNVRFVYMTGHADSSADQAILDRNNNMIRDYVRAHGKILYDFNDIEIYRPDGTLPAGDADSHCIWCEEWCANHACPDYGDCSQYHTQRPICYLKGSALWWLSARVVGWNGTTH